jgi:hypothetical protein
LENVHPHTATVPPNQADLQIIRENRVNPCLERLDRLESVFNQLSRKPPELPQDKDRAIQDSFDRIKSIEFDLEKTKKVNLCFLDLMVLRVAFRHLTFDSMSVITSKILFSLRHNFG